MGKIGGIVNGTIPPPDIPPDESGSGFTGDPTLITPTGGLFGIESLFLIPMLDDELGRYFGIFDIENFDCESDFFYDFKEEEVLLGREITVNKVRIRYRNLGPFKLEAKVVAYSQIKKKFVEESQIKNFGTSKADRKIYTDYFSFVVTGERPQLRLYKKAGWGQLAIVEASLCTATELAEQM
jgi:hypothetical protein